MHGGKRSGAGRKTGSQNKTTAEIRDYAREYSEAAIKALVAVMESEGTPAAAKVSAANSLLDRAHGKPSQSLDIEHSGAASFNLIITRRIIG